jgi:hypothetical protein
MRLGLICGRSRPAGIPVLAWYPMTGAVSQVLGERIVTELEPVGAGKGVS